MWSSYGSECPCSREIRVCFTPYEVQLLPVMYLLFHPLPGGTSSGVACLESVESRPYPKINHTRSRKHIITSTGVGLRTARSSQHRYVGGGGKAIDVATGECNGLCCTVLANPKRTWNNPDDLACVRSDLQL